MKYVKAFKHHGEFEDYCSECEGEGFTVRLHGGYSRYDGSPYESTDTCETCDGTGRTILDSPYILVDERGYEHVTDREEYFERLWEINDWKLGTVYDELDQLRLDQQFKLLTEEIFSF
jgi:hypothetical protein